MQRVSPYLSLRDIVALHFILLLNILYILYKLQKYIAYLSLGKLILLAEFKENNGLMGFILPRYR